MDFLTAMQPAPNNINFPLTKERTIQEVKIVQIQLLGIELLFTICHIWLQNV